MIVDYKSKPAVIKKEYYFQDRCLRNDVSEYRRDEWRYLSEMLFNLRGKYKEMNFEVAVLSPDWDDVVGSIEVKLTQGQYTAVGSGILLVDAVKMAAAKLEQIIYEDQIKVIEVSEPVVVEEKPKI